MIKGHFTMTVSPDYARRELVEELLNNGEAIVRLKNIGENNVVSFELLSDIVHCKDCINFMNDHLCLHWSKHGTIETELDDFCSKGERL